MNPASYIAIYIIVFVFLFILPSRNRMKMRLAQMILRKRNKRESEAMKEFANKYIGKKCVFNVFNGSSYIGVVKEVSENAVVIDEDGEEKIINLDFVMCIREVPKNKKGEYKNVLA